MQQIFIELTLRAEQDEYASEGIQWTPIPFFNNRIVCELLDANRPPGIFRILDDTCKTRHAAEDTNEIDMKMLESANQTHGQHAHFSLNGTSFIIKHYAGEVQYQAGNFGEANKDSLSKDLVQLLQGSGNYLVSQVFYGTVDTTDMRSTTTAGSRIRTQSSVSYLILS